MLKKIRLALDSTDPTTWKDYEAESLGAFLSTKFEHLPETAKIYHKYVSRLTEVTPATKEDCAKLEKLEGPFFVVVYPGHPGLIIFGAVLFAVAVTYLIPDIPAPPTATQRNQDVASSNNELSDRTNRARINGRIPDIFGTVRSVPDLISEPYKIFENNVEVEFALMCIGRGYYDVSDIRDGDTLCRNIQGTTVQVYEPFASPNNDVGPYIVEGLQRDIPIIRSKRNNSVNGQVLRPPNVSSFQAAQNVRFVYPNILELTPGSPLKFTESFVPGDLLDISAAAIVSGVQLSETIRCRATFVDLRQTYIGPDSPYQYETSGGALVIAIGNTVAHGLFQAGASIEITTLKYEKGHPFAPSGLNLNGTYEIESVTTTEYSSGSAGQSQKNFDVPMYIIVKLVSPELINPDWEELENGGDSWDHRTEAGIFELDIEHAGSAVTYNADLAGTYSVLSVTDNQITLDDPESVNSDWGILDSNGGVSPYLSPLIVSNEQGRWVGPFILTDRELSVIMCNFVAQQGLYKDDGTTQVAESVQIEVEATPVDEFDDPISDPELFTITLVGSPNLKETVASTLHARFSSFYGRCSVRARRVSLHDDTYEGTVVDEVRWRDIYSGAYIEKTEFGNVTIVQSAVFATASALAVKQRKLNMLVSRKLPTYSGGVFDDETLVATDNAADIFIAICRDKYLGNRQLNELDVANIYATVASVVDYFGHANAGKFSYTFDKDNVSFEEMAQTVAAAVFCTPYRRGNVFKLSFEKQTADSTILFNHRNKVPGTEKRNFSFGYVNDYDGIEYSYVNPDDDSILTVFLPEGYAAINPKKIESIGVRNHLQAYFHANRAWNKIKYQYLTSEFEATSEAELVIKNDRILVADNTRPNTQDGEVVDVDTLELELSQEVDLSLYSDYTINLQHYDGTTENILITAGSASNKVLLGSEPALPLSTAKDNFAKATYIIVGNEEQQQIAFLMQEREQQSQLTHTVKAINYDDRYYANDLDYINEVITEQGYGPSGGFVPAPAVPPYNVPESSGELESFDIVITSANPLDFQAGYIDEFIDSSQGTLDLNEMEDLLHVFGLFSGDAAPYNFQLTLGNFGGSVNQPLSASEVSQALFDHVDIPGYGSFRSFDAFVFNLYTSESEDGPELESGQWLAEWRWTGNGAELPLGEVTANVILESLSGQSIAITAVEDGSVIGYQKIYTVSDPDPIGDISNQPFNTAGYEISALGSHAPSGTVQLLIVGNSYPATDFAPADIFTHLHIVGQGMLLAADATYSTLDNGIKKIAIWEWETSFAFEDTETYDINFYGV